MMDSNNENSRKMMKDFVDNFFTTHDTYTSLVHYILLFLLDTKI